MPGDVIGTPELTPVAPRAGDEAAGALDGGDNQPLDYHNIPTAVFCQPNIGTVGLSEEAARAQYGEDILVLKASFAP